LQNGVAISVYQTPPARLKLSSLSADILSVTDNQQLPAQAVRSKGQATLHPDGGEDFPTSVRDISPSGIGVLASCPVSPGTFVSVDIHGHAAQGVVQACQPEAGQFYIAIALDQSTPEQPAA